MGARYASNATPASEEAVNALWSLEVHQPCATNGAQLAHSFDPEDIGGLVGCARRMLAKDATRPVRIEVWRADVNGDEGMDAAINWSGETGDESEAFAAGLAQDGMPAELMSALFDVPLALLEKVCAPVDFREDGVQAGTIYRPTKQGRKVQAIAPRLSVSCVNDSTHDAGEHVKH